MANPFYVQPGNDFGQGLAGLGQAFERTGEIKRQREEETRVKKRFDDAKAAMTAAFQSGDPEQIMQASIDYPELQKTGEMMFGFTNDKTKEVVRDTYRRVLSDPQNAQQYLQDGINRVAEFGGKPVNMMTDLGMFLKNPDAAYKSVRSGFALIAPEEHKAMFPQGVSSMMGKYNPRDYTAESWAQFMQNGDPATLQRFAPSQIVNVGGVPNVFAPAAGGISPASVSGAPVTASSVAESEAEIAGKKAEAETKARLAIDKAGAFGKKMQEQSDVNDILDIAEPLLEKSTESLAGSAVDAMGRIIGVSTEGAEAAAQLKALEGALILRMPRMEGPQSNADGLLYRQMAAQIGDSTIPASIRKAAMSVLRQLNSKYKQAPASTGQNRVKWDEM